MDKSEGTSLHLLQPVWQSAHGVAPAPLDHSLDKALRDLASLLTKRGDMTRGQLDACLRSVCASAREARLPPERLLVRLKRTLDTLPAAIQVDDFENSDLREHVVSLTIDAYFSNDA